MRHVIRGMHVELFAKPMLGLSQRREALAAHGRCEGYAAIRGQWCIPLPKDLGISHCRDIGLEGPIGSGSSRHCAISHDHGVMRGVIQRKVHRRGANGRPEAC